MSELPFDWPRSVWVADGHSVDIVLSDGGYAPRMTCPGHGVCRARSDGVGACQLDLWFRDAGMEFFEWQRKPYRYHTLPAVIEWRWEGWDDAAELFWRPLLPVSAERITEIAFQAAGAATVPFMKAHPDMVMPEREIVAGVEAVLREFEL